MTKLKKNLANVLNGSMPDMRMTLWLDGYEDLFSPFDARAYDERTISDDFVEECKKIMAEEPSWVKEIRLWVPPEKRNIKDEYIIKKKLYNFFLVKERIYEIKLQKEKTAAWVMSWIWVVIWLFVTYLLYQQVGHPFMLSLLSVVGEPASWFLIWTGADRLVALYKHDVNHENFYHKMSKAKFVFYNKK